jgi:hypothetical protein
MKDSQQILIRNVKCATLVLFNKPVAANRLRSLCQIGEMILNRPRAEGDVAYWRIASLPPVPGRDIKRAAKVLRTLEPGH